MYSGHAKTVNGLVREKLDGCRQTDFPNHLILRLNICSVRERMIQRLLFNSGTRVMGHPFETQIN